MVTVMLAIESARRVNAAIDRRARERAAAAATARARAESDAEMHARAAAINCPAAAALLKRRREQEFDKKIARRCHAAGVALATIAIALGRAPEVIALWNVKTKTPPRAHEGRAPAEVGMANPTATKFDENLFATTAPSPTPPPPSPSCMCKDGVGDGEEEEETTP